MPTLFDPLTAGAFKLRNRIVMSALTRSRAGRTHIPNDLMMEYYSQRASAGLVITEATMVAADACAFIGEGGLFDDATAAGWRKVTDAVHARGGSIIVQLWHPGRAAHSILNDGVQPISSTDRAIRNSTIHTTQGERSYEAPRRLALEEIPGIVELFRSAAARSREAGFDGVQLHGAHGYLLDQFLRDGTNDRTDAYGGPLKQRARLLLECTDAAISEIGADRVAVRISPMVAYNDMADSDPPALVRYVASQLSARKIAFFELRQSNLVDPAEQQLARIARESFNGPLFVNGGYDFASGQAAVTGGVADAVVYGTLYVSNPDLVERFAKGSPLNPPQPKTFYTPGPLGYTDYPQLAT